MLSHLKAEIRKYPRLERAARFVLDKRFQLASKHVRGIGIEIGALNRPLALPSHATAYYLDRLLPSQLRHHYPELGDAHFFVSLVGDGEKMECIRDHSLDFIVANHVIEHCEDPIQTLKTFALKVREGGKVFMAVPDMRHTFDRLRQETTWEHLARDHEQGAQLSRHDHYLQWATFVKGLDGDAAQQYAAELETSRYSIHFHCWTRRGFEDFLLNCSRFVPLTLSESTSWRDENIFVLARTMTKAS